MLISTNAATGPAGPTENARKTEAFPIVSNKEEKNPIKNIFQ